MIFCEELSSFNNSVDQVSMQQNSWSTESRIYQAEDGSKDYDITTPYHSIKHETEERFQPIPYGGVQFMPILENMMLQDDVPQELKEIEQQIEVPSFNISVDAISTQQNNSSPESGVNQAEDGNYNDQEETSNSTIEETITSDQIAPILDNTVVVQDWNQANWKFPVLEPLLEFQDVFNNEVVLERQEYDNVDNITASIDNKVVGLDPWIGGCHDSEISPPLSQIDVISGEDDLQLSDSEISNEDNHEAPLVSEIDGEDDHAQPPSCDQELATGILHVKNKSVTQVTMNF